MHWDSSRITLTRQSGVKQVPYQVSVIYDNLQNKCAKCVFQIIFEFFLKQIRFLGESVQFVAISWNERKPFFINTKKTTFVDITMPLN